MRRGARPGDAVLGPRRRIAVGEQSRHERGVLGDPEALAFEDEERQPRVEREFGKLPAEWRDAVADRWTGRTEAPQSGLGGRERRLVGGLEPGECLEIALPPGGELQGGSREVGAADLGAAALLHAALLVFGPQTEAPAGSLPAGAAGALLGRGA